MRISIITLIMLGTSLSCLGMDCTSESNTSLKRKENPALSEADKKEMLHNTRPSKKAKFVDEHWEISSDNQIGEINLELTQQIAKKTDLKRWVNIKSFVKNHPELFQIILEYLNIYELNNIWGICKDLELNRKAVLNRRNQYHIHFHSHRTLNSYIKTFESIPKILNVMLHFTPSADVLEELTKKCSRVVIPVPIGDNWLEKTRELLKKPNVYFIGKDFNKASLAEMKKLWDSLNEDSQCRLNEALEDYEAYLNASNLKDHLELYPFLRQVNMSSPLPYMGAISEALNHNNNITTIHAALNIDPFRLFRMLNFDLTDHKKFINFLHLLQCHPSLTSLDIETNMLNFRKGFEVPAELKEAERSILRTIADLLAQNIVLKSFKFKMQKNKDCMHFLADGLKNNASLTSLSLEDQEIRDTEVMMLASAISNHSCLTHVNLRQNKITEVGAAAVIKAVSKRSTPISLTFRANFHSFFRDMGKTLFAALGDNKSITSLDLRSVDMTDKESLALSEFLKKDKTLTSLNLRFNDFEEEGIKLLADSLRENTALRFLDCRDLLLKVSGAKAFAQALKTNTTLLHLKLGVGELFHGMDIEKSAYIMGEEGAIELAEALKENDTLRLLDLSYHQIGDKGAEAFSEVLRQNTTLRSLDLSANNLNNQQLCVLTNGLAHNQTLTSLNLSNNDIDDSGLLEFAEVVKNHDSLKSLRLNESREISFVAVISMLQILKANTTLMILDMGVRWWCPYLHELQGLIESLEENKTLASLKMWLLVEDTPKSKELIGYLKSRKPHWDFNIKYLNPYELMEKRSRCF